MNANELADKLERDGKGCTCAAYCAGECACDANWAEYHTKEAATMLRQQQAEIEALEQSKDRLIKTLLDVRGQHPVAYANKYADGKELLDNGTDLTAEESIPLYTHPVKELTDEEIENIFQDETGFTLDCDAKVDEVAMLDFSRAILRKAQEK